MVAALILFLCVSISFRNIPRPTLKTSVNHSEEDMTKHPDGHQGEKCSATPRAASWPPTNSVVNNSACGAIGQPEKSLILKHKPFQRNGSINRSASTCQTRTVDQLQQSREASSLSHYLSALPDLGILSLSLCWSLIDGSERRRDLYLWGGRGEGPQSVFFSQSYSQNLQIRQWKKGKAWPHERGSE